MFVVYSGMLVILLAFFRYSFFGGLTHGSLVFRGWSLESMIIQAPAWITTLLRMF